MPFRHHGFALALAWLMAQDGAFAQPPNDDASVLQARLAGPELLTVTRVNPNGTILLGPSETLSPQFRDAAGGSIAEGFYLLVTNDSKPAGERRVLRVQVTDVAAGPIFTLKTGSRAAARVRINDLARLVRPVSATTAQLRALPDEIPLRSEPARANANPSDDRESAARAGSINNLRMIGLGMHQFLNAYRKFPPAVIYGPDGKPWHSWRVLILPYLEQRDLYNAYDFSQPWDSPKNAALVDKMPGIYGDPIYGDAKEHYTHYAALVGPGAIFRPEGAKQVDPKKPPLCGGGVGIENIIDGTVNTVMVSSVEPARKIPWTKPEDIDVGPAFKGVGQPAGIAAPYTFRVRRGANAAPFLFADGSVRMVGAFVDPRTLAALITTRGMELISSNSYPTESEPRVPQVKTLLKIRLLSGGEAIAAIE